MHFGQHDAATERAKEADLIRCLQAHRVDVAHLYLMGDVFNEYIEYRHLIPKGCARLLGLLATWTDAGVPITYLTGNHDPWHRDYFTDELGVRLVFDALVEPTEGPVVYLEHGDAVASHASAYRRLRPWLRHPLPVWLYRSLLPGDMGFQLARWVSHTLHKDAPDGRVVRALETHARSVLQSTAASLVVMGHSHVPALHSWPEGTYVNTGNWYESRTFARLDPNGVQLLRWNGDRATAIESASCPF